MTTYSTIAQLPLPANTDGLVAESTFGDYASALDTMLVPQYSTVAARDAAMVSGKIEGQVCAVAGELQYWDGQAWWYQGNRNVVLKGTDTSRTSTVTVTADPQLSFAVKSGGTYYISAWLVPLSTNTGIGFRYKWTSLSGNVTFTRASQIGPINGATSVVTNLIMTGASATSETILGTPNSGQNLVRSQLVVTATADDTVQLHWAQGALSATALTLSGRSHIEYRRVG